MEDWKEKASDATRLSILSRQLTLASSPPVFRARWHVLLVQFLGVLAAKFFTIERRRIPMARWLATHGFFWGLPGQIAVVLCRLAAASSSSYSPRVTRPGRQTAGLLLVQASRVASLSLLLQHRTDVIGRASPTKVLQLELENPGRALSP